MSENSEDEYKLHHLDSMTLLDLRSQYKTVVNELLDLKIEFEDF